MRKISDYIKGFKKIKDQQDLSEVLEKVTKAVDDKLVELHEERKEKELDPVIISDEKGNFVDCCNIVKPDAPTDYFAAASYVLKYLTEVEQNVRYRLKRWAVIFYTVLMFIYTGFCISHITDLGNRLVVEIFVALFAVLFIVMTVINIVIYKNTKLQSSETSRNIKIMKNYKSAAVILRRSMLLWSLGITVYSMIVTWEQGPAYQVLNIFMLILTMLMLLYILYREIKKISKRTKPIKKGKLSVIFSTVKNVASKTKTADYLATGELKLEAPKQPQSEFEAKRNQRREIAKAKRNVKRNNIELKKAYKDNYKSELKKLKEKYLDDLDKL